MSLFGTGSTAATNNVFVTNATNGTFGNFYNTWSNITTSQGAMTLPSPSQQMQQVLAQQQVAHQMLQNAMQAAQTPIQNPYPRNQPMTVHGGDLTLVRGYAGSIKLPDGAVIEMHSDGSFTIDDANAVNVYRGNPTYNFNTYLNASDRIEEFIQYCGAHGISKQDMMDLPMSLFIGWLILEAARADEEEEDEAPLLARLKKRSLPRCIQCQRFLPHDYPRLRLEFCKPVCFERYQMKLTAPPARKLLAAA